MTLFGKPCRLGEGFTLQFLVHAFKIKAFVDVLLRQIPLMKTNEGVGLLLKKHAANFERFV